MGDQAKEENIPIGMEKFRKVIGNLNYENLIVSESGTLFIQFIAGEGEQSKTERLKRWLWNKVGDQMIPKYNKQFNLKIEANQFPTHIEIKKLHDLPEVKIKKFFNLFKWVHDRL